LKDTPENRKILADLLKNPSKTSKVNLGNGITQNFNLPNPFDTPNAFGETFPKKQTVIDGRLDPNRPVNLDQFVKLNSRSKKPVKSTSNIVTIRGSSQSELGTGQEFQVFGRNSNNQVVKGVIREAPKKASELRTDSKKNPLETASQRASRVFEDTGKFAGEGRGFKITKAKVETRNFDFGTNTGHALTKKTTGKNAKLRLAERKRLEDKKALSIFNSRSISNF